MMRKWVSPLALAACLMAGHTNALWGSDVQPTTARGDSFPTAIGANGVLTSSSILFRFPVLSVNVPSSGGGASVAVDKVQGAPPRTRTVVAFGNAVNAAGRLLVADNAAFTKSTPAQTYKAKSDRIVLATDDSGVDPTGTTDSGAAINRLLVGGSVKITLPCGTYLISTPILIPSNSSLIGSGACSELRGSVGLTSNSQWVSAGYADVAVTNIVSNSNFVSGNSNIEIANLKITQPSAAAAGNEHLVSFVNASYVNVNNIIFIGSNSSSTQDAISFVKSSRYYVENNKCYAVSNACYDQWSQVHDFVISNNVVEGGGRLTYGILINAIVGPKSARVSGTSYNGVISGNVVKNTTNVGIGVWALSFSSAVSYVKWFTISSNVVDTVSKYYGIYVAQGDHVVVTSNVVRESAGNGIHIASVNEQAITDITVTGNTIERSSKVNNGVYVGASASNVTIFGNRISVGAYSLYVAKGATYTNIGYNNIKAGATGAVIDRDTNSVDFR